MPIITSLVTAPKREPVELQDIERHLRLDIDYPEEQELLELYITAARKRVEDLTGRKLIHQVWKYYLEDWPTGDYIKIPYPPLYALTSNAIKYRDSDYTEQTMDSGDYRVLTNIEPGRITLDYGATWPSDTLIGNAEAIYIEYTCGYGTGRTNVPEELRIAIMQIVGTMYENRETTSPQIIVEVPQTAYMLIEPFRVSRLGL